MVRRKENKAQETFEQNPQAAVALKYDKATDEAPRVIAKGRGYVAAKIVQVAQENRVPLYVNPELTRLLYEVSLDKAVPASVYEVVAEIFAWVYTLDTQNKD